jgi:hypothetical protein
MFNAYACSSWYVVDGENKTLWAGSTGLIQTQMSSLQLINRQKLYVQAVSAHADPVRYLL